MSRSRSTEKLTNHHITFPRKAHEGASQAHKTLRNHHGLIVPMPARLHNEGQDALHANVYGVAVVPEYLANRVKELTLPNLEPDQYLHNLDLLATGYEVAAQRAFEPSHADACLMAADSLIRQRSYIAQAVGHSVIYVLGDTA